MIACAMSNILALHAETVPAWQNKMPLFTCMLAFICICIHIQRETERETERDRTRERERQRERQ